MALVDCQDCGRKISSVARDCPHCLGQELDSGEVPDRKALDRDTQDSPSESRRWLKVSPSRAVILVLLIAGLTALTIDVSQLVTKNGEGTVEQAEGSADTKEISSSKTTTAKASDQWDPFEKCKRNYASCAERAANRVSKSQYLSLESLDCDELRRHRARSADRSGRITGTECIDSCSFSGKGVILTCEGTRRNRNFRDFTAECRTRFRVCEKIQDWNCVKDKNACERGVNRTLRRQLRLLRGD